MQAIIAHDLNYGIGYKNTLPWRSIKADMAHFKAITLDKTVVMGITTWLSLPVKPLPRRRHVVLSNSLPLCKDYVLYKNIDELLANESNSIIIGGSKLLLALDDRIKLVHETIIHDRFNCDTYVHKELFTGVLVQTKTLVCDGLLLTFNTWQR